MLRTRRLTFLASSRATILSRSPTDLCEPVEFCHENMSPSRTNRGSFKLFRWATDDTCSRKIFLATGGAKFPLLRLQPGDLSRLKTLSST